MNDETPALVPIGRPSIVKIIFAPSRLVKAGLLYVPFHFSLFILLVLVELPTSRLKEIPFIDIAHSWRWVCPETK